MYENLAQEKTCERKVSDVQVSLYTSVMYKFVECVSGGFTNNSLLCFLDPEGSLSAMMVVVLVVLTGGVVTRFQKMPKALLICNGKL